MGIWGIPDDARRAALARLAPPQSLAPSDGWALNPALEEELKDELARCEAEYGDDARVRRATIVACLARLARDVLRHDETCIDAEFILERALDPNAPAHSPALDKIVAEVRIFIQEAREPQASMEDLALDALHAFLFEKALLTGQLQARETATWLAGLTVMQAEKRGVTFDKEARDVVMDAVDRLHGVAAAYRPSGRFKLAAFLTKRLQFRLDDELRRVGSVRYSTRRIRELKQAGLLPRDQSPSEEALVALNAHSISRQRHAVPAGCVNNKALHDELVDQYDQAAALHAVGKGPPADERFNIGQRTVDKLVTSFERHRGALYPRVGRSKSIPRGDIPAIVEFLKSR